MQVDRNYDFSELQRLENSKFSNSLAQNVVQQTTNTDVLPSMLKFSTFLSQFPGIFSNINILSTDFDDEFCKTIDSPQKVY